MRKVKAKQLDKQFFKRFGHAPVNVAFGDSRFNMRRRFRKACGRVGKGQDPVEQGGYNALLAARLQGAMMAQQFAQAQRLRAAESLKQ